MPSASITCGCAQPRSAVATGLTNLRSSHLAPPAPQPPYIDGAATRWALHPRPGSPAQQTVPPPCDFLRPCSTYHPQRTSLTPSG
ncbi:hypothetical protein HBI81_055340 [Parastagonospora nodorum]|nr:hypothetical protein HBI10_094990 [Parastagonospora nodorum]KAH4403935.1 hypothetical protein HBH99_085440 [Parastagonospora nodorum]KAH5086050.1 hypothetical protein HBH95_011500 [Parastagonospora nodorum]KAH5103766.1 hypothetical protein HBH72_073010 [Parastagonospora nodorum]KAH5201134.1 hypothetical protein HBH76_011120 [Parastagonospora nodorum]